MRNTHLNMEAVFITQLFNKSSVFFFALFIIVNIVWINFTNMKFEFASYTSILAVVGLVGAIFLYYTFKRPDKSISSLTGGIVYFILATNITVITSYLSTTVTFPFQDQLFNQMDLTLGFNLVNSVAYLDQFPTIIDGLKFFYDSFSYQIYAIMIILSLKNSHRITEFCHLYFLTLSITIFIAAFLPALGPYEYLNLNPELIPNIGEIRGRMHIDPILSLRNADPMTINFNNLEGLISFPSFHTIMALLIVYALRGIKWVFPLACIVNAIVIIATVPIGGHYVADLIGGALLTLICILAYNKMTKPQPE